MAESIAPLAWDRTGRTRNSTMHAIRPSGSARVSVSGRVERGPRLGERFAARAMRAANEEMTKNDPFAFEYPRKAVVERERTGLGMARTKTTTPSATTARGAVKRPTWVRVE